MATLVSDNFTRANNPTTLGTATTGQVWDQVSGNWGIDTNSALVTWDNGDPLTSIAAIESGFEDAVTSVVLPSIDVPNFAAGIGIICRYVDVDNYWRLLTFDFPGDAGRVRLQRVYGGSVSTVIDLDPPVINNGDTLAVACCGPLFEVRINGVVPAGGTYDDTGNPQNYGTKCGLVSVAGTTFFLYSLNFDDFLVTTNADCSTPTYNCTGGACVDPGDGTGTYATLEECLAACGGIAASYNCVDGVCVDPGDGSGAFSTLLACELSGCAARVAETRRFDAGTGSSYYVVAQVSDSGDDLRSKTVKSIRTTGIRTNVSGMAYGYDVNQEISVDDLETGTRTNTRMTTRPQDFSDSTGVTQSERKPINVANAVLSTVRIEGDDTGNEQRDRIDEIIVEQAKQGVRR